MATNNKDFVVKNGLLVTNGAIFGDAVEVGSPIHNNHATTKSYVDNLVASVGGGGGAGIIVSDTEPSTPLNGSLWLDTTIDRLKIYYSGLWTVLATAEDATYLQDHTHDTSIDGSGLISNIYTSAETLSDAQIIYLDGGTPSTTVFDNVLDAGTV